MVVHTSGVAAMTAAIYLLGFSTAVADTLSDLDKAFRDAYAQGTSRTFQNLRSRVPVLVNRFGQIAFYRPGVDRPEIFSMDMRAYLEARSFAHTPVALCARLQPFGFGALDADRLDWLSAYRDLLAKAEQEVADRDDIAQDLRKIRTDLLQTVRQYVERIYQRGSVDLATLEEMRVKVREGIEKNLMVAASSQLEQFRDQTLRWKRAYPGLRWDDAVVVVVGGHQARDGYLQRQFFDWMLNDQPDIEANVVYAESLTSPPSLEKDPATDAMNVLSKVMFDKGISSILFEDPLALQSDVLGKAASEVISSWPR